MIQKYWIQCFPPHLSPAQYQYQQDNNYLCFVGYQYFEVILDFLSDLFHQFLILLFINHLIWFLLSDLFHQILYHQSHPSDFFHLIISQYCLYFSANPIYQFQDFYIYRITYSIWNKSYAWLEYDVFQPKMSCSLSFSGM